MTAKHPTASGISRLLAKAGFERSTYGRPGVMWNEVSDGFSVWKSYHGDFPEQPFVAVQHIARSMQDGSNERTDVKSAMLARLKEYAAVIRAAGYAPVVRDRGKEPPWLTILTVVPEAGE